MDPTAVLTTRLIVEERSVTYSALARTLGSSVQQAKDALEAFYRKYTAAPPSDKPVYATYVVTGLVAGVAAVRLVEALAVDSTKLLFDSVALVHVYSLSPRAGTGAASVWEPREAALPASDDQLKALGVLVCPARPVPRDVKSRPKKKAKTEAPKEAKAETAAAPAYTLAKKLVSAFDIPVLNYVSRKNSPAAPKQPTPVYTLRKNEQKRPKERVVVGDGEAEDDSVPSQATASSASVRAEQLKELEGMFDDDDDEWDAPVKQEPVDVSVKESLPESFPESLQESLPESLPESLAESLPGTPGESVPGTSPAPEPAVETYVDDEGYTVTKTAKAKAAPKAATKPTRSAKRPAPSLATGKTKKPVQLSLMSFFGAK